MGIVGIVHCRTCQHTRGAKVYWVENEIGKPPILEFQGFPVNGVIVMSQAVVIVVCLKCSDEMNDPSSENLISN